jgi:outer membrane protein assembly factor BamB
MPLGVGDPMDDVGGRRRISEEASMTRVLGVLMLSAPLLLGASRAADATITPTNVGRLALKWDFPGGTITGGPAFADGVVYAGAWNGNVYALDPHTGAVRWTAATASGIQGSVLPLPDGRICFGDATARVTCLDAEDGSQLWRTQIGDPSVDNIWSAPAVDVANNRIYVGIASHTDNPCTKGQLVALNLETGVQLWSLQTVPDKVCARNTSTSCVSPSDCPGNSACVDAVGAGVTASPLLGPAGTYVYMNTVGCFTFPSVGDSDSVFKVEAATGNLVWKTRVNLPEQFGFCEDDTSAECGSDAMCSTGVCRQRCVSDTTVECRNDSECPGAGNSCRAHKNNYHDFGFLNGPLLIEAEHGNPGCPTNTLVVSGSKNGTLYAFCETTGQIVWSRAVQPTPISPGFAGFGLFNGAIAYADGRIFAALNSLIPARVCDNDHSAGCASDGDCFGGTCLPEPEHLMAFQATDGSTAWSDEIGRSWGHVRVENGVVYSGTGTFFGGATEVYAYDAANGTRLGTFPLPIASASRPLVVDDTLYVGYGLIGGGGIRAFSLCGNGDVDVDDGEQCDDAGAGDCCAPDCTLEAAGAPCDDGTYCTAEDSCDDSGTCGGTGNPCAGTACAVCQEDLDRCVDENGIPCGTEPLCRSASDCDDGNPCTSDTCDPATGCASTAAAGTCSDGDNCTADTCVAGACVGNIDTPDGMTCAYDQLAVIECDGEALPKKLKKAITKKVKRSRKLFDKAAKASSSGKQEKAAALLGKAATQLDAIVTQADKAVASSKPSKSITAACGERIRSLVQNRQQVVSGYVF